jgi:DNA repair protein RecN (Recombination protein N)
VLRELRVESYAVIDNVVVEFSSGLNLLTGETGAGKSILIDALALLLGEKASSDVIRHGASKAVISAVFDLEGDAVPAILEENGLDAEDGQIILRREIAAGRQGPSLRQQPARHRRRAQATRAELGHRPRTTRVGARVRSSQCASRCSTPPPEPTSPRWPTATSTGARFAARIADLEQGEQDKLRQVDLWTYQLKEIEAAAPLPGEDQQARV